jgi:hypothetical protein
MRARLLRLGNYRPFGKPKHEPMSLKIPSPNARETATQLLAYETGAGEPPDASFLPAIRVCEKLRRPICTLAGSTGFNALLGRALNLAKAQDPQLAGTRVQLDGSLEGFNEPRIHEDGPAGLVLIEQLLSLIHAFIGQDLTLRLMAEVWPDLPALGAEVDGEMEE